LGALRDLEIVHSAKVRGRRFNVGGLLCPCHAASRMLILEASRRRSIFLSIIGRVPGPILPLAATFALEP
jgi:hypothetical protein